MAETAYPRLWDPDRVTREICEGAMFQNTGKAAKEELAGIAESGLPLADVPLDGMDPQWWMVFQVAKD